MSRRLAIRSSGDFAWPGSVRDAAGRGPDASGRRAKRLQRRAVQPRGGRADAGSAKLPGRRLPAFPAGPESITSSGNSTRAITVLERAVQLAPKDSAYHDWLGKAYGRKAEESMFLSAMGLARKTHKEFEIAVQLESQEFRGAARFDPLRDERSRHRGRRRRQGPETYRGPGKTGQPGGAAGARRIPDHEEGNGKGRRGVSKNTGIEHRPHRRLLRGGGLLSRPRPMPKK